MLLPIRDLTLTAVVPLHLKKDLEGLTDSGDYCWQQHNAFPFDILILSCPFCNRDAPVPTLIKVFSKQPITIEGEMHCGFCGVGFRIIDGVAARFQSFGGKMPVVKKGFIRVVPKVWGEEHWIANTEQYCLKVLNIKPNGCSSLHYHKTKDETFFVDLGTCFLELENVTYELHEQDSIRIRPGQKHRFWCPAEKSKYGCMITEVSTHHDDNDVVRLEESKMLQTK